MSNIKYFILGITTTLIIMLLCLHKLIPNTPLGNCTVINADGTETVYNNCLVNIVVTQEKSLFFKYKRFIFVTGLK